MVIPRRTVVQEAELHWEVAIGADERLEDESQCHLGLELARNELVCYAALCT